MSVADIIVCPVRYESRTLSVRLHRSHSLARNLKGCRARHKLRNSTNQPPMYLLREGEAIPITCSSQLQHGLPYVLICSSLVSTVLADRQQHEAGQLVQQSSASTEPMAIQIWTFGHKWPPAPAGIDVTFDLRTWPNAPKQLRLRSTGLASKLKRSFWSISEVQNRYRELLAAVQAAIWHSQNHGERELVVGVGCHAGIHRSVACAERLAADLRSAKILVRRIWHNTLEIERKHDVEEVQEVGIQEAEALVCARRKGWDANDTEEDR